MSFDRENCRRECNRGGIGLFLEQLARRKLILAIRSWHDEYESRCMDSWKDEEEEEQVERF